MAMDDATMKPSMKMAVAMLRPGHTGTQHLQLPISIT
jgi:hypothetical protein